MKPTKNSLDIEEPIEQINTKEQKILSNAPVKQTVVQTQNTSVETKFDTPSSIILSEPIQQTNNTFNVSGMTIDALNLLQVSLQRPEFQLNELNGLIQSLNFKLSSRMTFQKVLTRSLIPTIKTNLFNFARLRIDQKYFSSKRNSKILYPSQTTQVYLACFNLILCQDHSSNPENRQTRKLLKFKPIN